MRRPAAGLMLGAFALLAGEAWAHDYALGAIAIEHPFAFATAPNAQAGAGYMTIRNEGAAPDRLLAVRTDRAEAMLHATEVDASGVARMTHQASIEIPAGGAVSLEPRGLHVMFMGLAAPLVEGERIEAVLVFETAGEIAVEFAVEARGQADSHAGH